jgi:hypothetical protein
LQSEKPNISVDISSLTGSYYVFWGYDAWSADRTIILGLSNSLGIGTTGPVKQGSGSLGAYDYSAIVALYCYEIYLKK